MGWWSQSENAWHSGHEVRPTLCVSDVGCETMRTMVTFTEDRAMRMPVMALFCVLGLVLVQPAVGDDDSEIVQAIRVVAGRLVLAQLASGPLEGAWPDEEAYTGSIVAGLVGAYGVTADEDARVAAITGGNFILRAAAGNYYGDEAYALMCLSRMSEGDTADMWRPALEEFYGNVSRRGTRDYISQFERADPSVAVFYLAHHTVSAFYVDADDREIWRQGLIEGLVRVDDDSSEAPVMALGMAAWALASTGTLGDCPLDPDLEETSYWYARTLGDLPDLLLTHRIPDGEFAGSFYWRFDHSSADLGGPPGGYTEELVSSALGLAVVKGLQDDPEAGLAIRQIRDLLVENVDVDGMVRQHVAYGGEAYHSEAAGVLRALAHLATLQDPDVEATD